jgi:hypothetical protein
MRGRPGVGACAEARVAVLLTMGRFYWAVDSIRYIAGPFLPNRFRHGTLTVMARAVSVSISVTMDMVNCAVRSIHKESKYGSKWSNNAAERHPCANDSYCCHHIRCNCYWDQLTWAQKRRVRGCYPTVKSFSENHQGHSKFNYWISHEVKHGTFENLKR